MLLILFRHGIAEQASPDGTDAARRLTAAGKAQVARAALGLKKRIGKPGRIISSPLVRADQTASILAKILTGTVSHAAELGRPRIGRIIAALGRRRERLVIAVGHQPMLGQTAVRLLTGRKKPEFIELDKAGAIALEWSGKAGDVATLMWMAAPGMLECKK